MGLVVVKPFHDQSPPRLEDVYLVGREVVFSFLHNPQDPNERQRVFFRLVSNEEDDSQIIVASNRVMDAQFTYTQSR
jgi:hypothetical protein